MLHALPRAVRVLPAGMWDATTAVAHITLPFADRHRRRLRLNDDTGQPFLLDLPTATRLEEGDGLALDDGGIIAVHAADEAVLDITCRDPLHGIRLAWHIGNRHVPMQVLADGRLRIAVDPVLADMVRGLGGIVSTRQAPFTPEGGAYAEPITGQAHTPPPPHTHYYAHQHAQDYAHQHPHTQTHHHPASPDNPHERPVGPHGEEHDHPPHH